MSEIHEIIRARRIDLGLTLKDVAKALGVSEGTVSRYESANIQNMGIDKISNLAKVLRCSPGYLMGWEDEPQPKGFRIGGLNDNENRLMSNYRQLNKDGQSQLLQRSEELLKLGYTNPHKELRKDEPGLPAAMERERTEMEEPDMERDL